MWRSRLTMVQVCFADAARPEASQKYSAEMRETATRIRSKFGENSLYYFEVRAALEGLRAPTTLVEACGGADLCARISRSF